MPVIKDLVLIGGGHSHVKVLKAFGMRPLAGVRITLISQDTQTIYSGMLPGLIAGHYSIDQAHIDLAPLARFAGARFIRAKAISIDHQACTVSLEGRPPVSYDVLSVNSGSLPSTEAVVGAEGVVIPVKPINQFLVHWQQLLQRVEARDGRAGIAVVGGGAGAVELALSVQYALNNLWKTSFSIDILTADPEILVGYHSKVGKRFRRILSERKIDIHVDSRVIDVEKGFMRTASGREFEFEEILWVTQAAPPSWLANSGLGVDGEGFLLVDDHLQSVSHPDIFGAGDAATMVSHPRPKSGVFAVRQGAPLARNLRSFLLKRSLSRYKPQRHYLSLIGTGAKYAVGARAFWSVEGSWVWSWKNWIDRRWMRQYQVLPEMSEALVAEQVPEQLIEPEVKDQLDDSMRCGGCGAKVGADILAAALSNITAVPRDDVIVGLNHPDDAALISIPEGKLSVLSVDFFRPIVNDPFIFGKIAANHCLNDIFAMGAD
ncbi:MAG: FAD-dependent oxidoreductase, partial [Pseudomonadota bacterium]|nr:FAD-dependent oxidoreductase [Pseudomonadota bacterium]